MFLNGSAPKTPPSSNSAADNLDEVAVRVKRIPEASSEDIPEIVVSAKRIPWYAWALAGVVGFAVVDALARRK